MAENSKIEWTHHTFNPWRGCSKISPGCEHCYAATMSKRNPETLGIWGQNGTRVVASEEMWREPLKWDAKAKGAGQRHRVFCASLADVFEDWTGPMQYSNGNRVHVGKAGAWFGKPIQWKRTESSETTSLTMCDVRRRLFETINATPNLDWLLLTKRPENFRRMLPDRWLDIAWSKNVWLGVSVENQDQADKRIQLLIQVPATVRFLSCEPMLGPIHFSDVTKRSDAVQQLGKKALSGIHWVIVGAESGHHRRPMKIEWAESIRDQCKAAGVAFFMKQMEINGKVEMDIEKFPAGMRVREFPGVARG